MDLFRDRELAQICFDHTLRLVFEGGEQLTIETDFQLCAANGTHSGESTAVSIGELPVHAAAILDFLHQRCRWASCSDEGTLLIQFDDGSQIKVPPDKQFEAWNYSGPRQRKAVCSPGGKVAIWRTTDHD